MDVRLKRISLYNAFRWSASSVSTQYLLEKPVFPQRYFPQSSSTNMHLSREQLERIKTRAQMALRARRKARSPRPQSPRMACSDAPASFIGLNGIKYLPMPRLDQESTSILEYLATDGVYYCTYLCKDNMFCMKTFTGAERDQYVLHVTRAHIAFVWESFAGKTVSECCLLTLQERKFPIPLRPLPERASRDQQLLAWAQRYFSQRRLGVFRRSIPAGFCIAESPISY